MLEGIGGIVTTVGSDLHDKVPRALNRPCILVMEAFRNLQPHLRADELISAVADAPLLRVEGHQLTDAPLISIESRGGHRDQRNHGGTEDLPTGLPGREVGW